jgi:hypothetical protein
MARTEYSGRILGRYRDKVLRVFLLAITSHGFYSFPPPLSKRGLKLVCNKNIVYRNLRSLKIMSKNLNEITKSYVHEFGFWTLPLSNINRFTVSPNKFLFPFRRPSADYTQPVPLVSLCSTCQREKV